MAIWLQKGDYVRSIVFSMVIKLMPIPKWLPLKKFSRQELNHGFLIRLVKDFLKVVLSSGRRICYVASVIYLQCTHVHAL